MGLRSMAAKAKPLNTKNSNTAAWPETSRRKGVSCVKREPKGIFLEVQEQGEVVEKNDKSADAA